MISQNTFTSGCGLIGTIISKMNNIGNVQQFFLMSIPVMDPCLQCK
jgi:hypothetical protein